MTGDSLTSLRVQGFKSLREVELDLRPGVNLLIGANGTGKSNLIAFFRLLSALARGKLQELVARQGGPDLQLFLGRKVTPEIVAEVGLGATMYPFRLVPTVTNQLIHADAGDDFSAELVRPLELWVVYHFHDTSDSAYVKQLGPITDGAVLRPDAANLAAFLYRLKLKHAQHYRRICEVVRLVAPFFDDFVLEPYVANEHMIQLEWRQRGSDYRFHGSQLSDGTLRFMCLAAALVQPRPPATILLDEPELGLHPYALELLGGLLVTTGQRNQVIVATQAAALLNHVEPEDVVVVEREQDQGSSFRRLRREDLREWLEEYTLAELWGKNVLGGRPR